MTRPIAFDVTNLASRLPFDAPSGIDKVDLAYADHFAEQPCDAVVHYGFRKPRVHSADAIRQLTAAGLARWSALPLEDDAAYARVFKALTGSEPAPSGAAPGLTQDRAGRGTRLSRILEQTSWRVSPGRGALPHGSIYLNVAQHAFEFPIFFRWLHERPDLRTVFLVHDLLPIDWPEYYPRGYKSRFLRRAETIRSHATAIVTTSRAVADRLQLAYASWERPAVPMHVEPLPSSLSLSTGGITADAGRDEALSTVPYFVVLGTIEPRKNHMLLLNIWRRLAEEHTSPPKLVIVGHRGWENEQVVDVLERSVLVRPHVIECAGLGDHGLARVIKNSRALLMPSFSEGYGLPIVEALTLGVPVVASDIPVFREISQARAVFRHPLDGPGWMQAILDLSDASSPLAQQAKHLASEYKPPTWESYFAGIRRFLAQL